MKITLNLAALPSPRERYALAWAVPLVLLGLGSLAILSALSTNNIREYLAVKRDISRLREQGRMQLEREKALRQNLEQPQQRKLSERAQFVNSLIVQKTLSVADLAGEVAGLMPSSVRLTGLALVQEKDGPLVRLAVAGRDEESVEKFLDGLENSPNFQDVTIANQGFESEAAEKGTVSLICTARYLPRRTS